MNRWLECWNQNSDLYYQNIPQRINIYYNGPDDLDGKLESFRHLNDSLPQLVHRDDFFSIPHAHASFIYCSLTAGLMIHPNHATTMMPKQSSSMGVRTVVGGKAHSIVDSESDNACPSRASSSSTIAGDQLQMTEHTERYARSESPWWIDAAEAKDKRLVRSIKPFGRSSGARLQCSVNHSEALSANDDVVAQPMWGATPGRDHTYNSYVVVDMLIEEFGSAMILPPIA